MHLNSYRAEINFTPKIMLRNKVSLSVLSGIMNTHCILKFYSKLEKQKCITICFGEICFCIFPFANRDYFDEFME